MLFLIPYVAKMQLKFDVKLPMAVFYVDVSRKYENFHIISDSICGENRTVFNFFFKEHFHVISDTKCGENRIVFVIELAMPVFLCRW